MLFAPLAAFCISFLFYPILLKICEKRKWFDTTGGRKVHKGNVPRLGSIGFVPLFFAVSAVIIEQRELPRLLPVYIPAFALFLFGIIDDFTDLRARVKLVLQCAVSLVPILSGLYLRELGPLKLGVFGPVLTFFYLLGFINAFNLIDGIDALCAGISLGSALSLAVIYAFAKLNSQSSIMFVLSATLAAFLFYNKPKAKIFMGDGGSQFLGFFLAAFPLLPDAPHIEYNKLPLMLALAAIPILDTIAAIWRRTRDGQLFFYPDNRHIHHKFLNMGYSVKSILIVLFIIQFGLCVVAVSAVHFIAYFRALFVLSACFVAVCLFFAVIHYTERAVTRIKTQTKMEFCANQPVLEQIRESEMILPARQSGKPTEDQNSEV
ncbi:MAG: MraY family glycosyltransferase [Treponemataceae bacterium]|nr:MAG: MraY family glycosyltransferase [Treponemataceae bacterium]GMO52950.1 MAG: MraY family glycosyltransferase [Treponemataceae bacterium]